MSNGEITAFQGDAEHLLLAFSLFCLSALSKIVGEVLWACVEQRGGAYVDRSLEQTPDLDAMAGCGAADQTLTHPDGTRWLHFFTWATHPWEILSLLSLGSTLKFSGCGKVASSALLIGYAVCN